MVIILRIYVAIALVIAAVFSPLALSLVSILLFLWYLYVWRWRIGAITHLLTEYFMFFAVALLFTPQVGPFFSLLISLPVLLLVNRSLEENAELLTYQDTRYTRQPTKIFLTLLLIAVLVLGAAGLVGSLSLLLSGATIIGYFGVLVAVVLRRLSSEPVLAEQLKQRMVAGSRAHLDIKLTVRTKTGGLLFVESPYEWVKVEPNILSLKQNELVVKVFLSPSLSGPSIIKLKGQAVDRWGLIQVDFELESVRLYVIPRARYASWLARRYLAQTKPGALPQISNIGALRPIYGLRRGVEYYGSQLYQPGDSLKNIDWKHSLKYNELISKEFADFHGQPAVVLINLAVSNAEEADKLSYNIVVTAISLAQESIPAALAAYDHESVKITTPMLQSQALVRKSLQVAQEMVAFISPVRYLNPPDVDRLRANISRIRFVESKASNVLGQLLQREYNNLNYNAKLNPVTKALTDVFGKVDKQSNIIIISHRNHDAEALAFNTFSFTRKGNAVITV
ncbi:DUF58 domain-containing protein [Chloroflexota bacterium]